MVRETIKQIFAGQPCERGAAGRDRDHPYYSADFQVTTENAGNRSRTNPRTVADRDSLPPDILPNLFYEQRKVEHNKAKVRL